MTSLDRKQTFRKFLAFAFPACLSVILFGMTVFFYLLPRMESAVMDSKRQTIRELVRSLDNLLQSYDADVNRGRIPLPEAQQRALRRIQSFRYGPDMNNYFWVLDLEGCIRMNPTRWDLVDRDFATLADPRIKTLIGKVLRLAKQRKSGFIEYLWQERKNAAQNQLKISYCQLFEPWGWIIGSGLYYADVRNEIDSLNRKVTLVSIGILAIVALLSGYLTWRGLVGIREQQHTETALQQSEIRFRKLFMMAPMPMMLVKRNDGIIEVNDPFEKTVGYTIDDLSAIGKWWELAYPDPDYRHKVMVAWRTVVNVALEASTLVEPGEYDIMCKDGNMRTMLAGASVIEDNILVSYLDITARKQAEKEHQKLQEQLLQSQKLEAVGILAGGVAHDFNNMLGAILGHAELALRKIDPSNPMHRHLSRIHDAAERSASLTRQLLAFARKQAMAPMVFDLNASVANMLNMLQRLIGENLTLEWLPTDAPCRVKMDPGQLDQILANLCVNARDAIADVGKISIKTALISFDEVSCKAIIDCTPGDYVQLAVSDNGCGMDPETARHIFEPFYTTKALGRGTGLGLSTVYGIIKQNNGFINLYSEPKIGSAFNIYLPYHVGENAEEVLPADDDIPKSQGETILMVEDDPMLQEMGGLILQHLGYTILSAATPTEAIQLAKENATDIDLFLTDVVMPEMNGRELAEKVSQICPHAKHLFMSGYTANIIAHRGILDEGINFIQKPFSLKDLAIKIRVVIDRNDSTFSG